MLFPHTFGASGPQNFDLIELVDKRAKGIAATLVKLIKNYSLEVFILVSH